MLIPTTTMRKRERENPCFICGHYHKFEDGEVCGVCGHRLPDASEKIPVQSAFSSEILPSFLYLGSYDNASRAELLKAQGITRILNAVPACQNLYKNSFTYKSLTEENALPFGECIEFIEQSRKDNTRVLVHCMSGQNRSPAIVIAYLMQHKGWRLPQSYQWVKDRRPTINLSSGVAQQLQAYEAEIFGSNASDTSIVSTQNGVAFGFGLPCSPTTGCSHSGSSSSSSPLLSLGSSNGPFIPSNFVFGATRPEQQVAASNTTSMESTMDSS